MRLIRKHPPEGELLIESKLVMWMPPELAGELSNANW
jgi:hypothetical protein